MENEKVIVGIGASAGGLEALQELVGKLPDDNGMAYIVTQHLSPTYKSMMVDLLAKGTGKKVLEAKDGVVVSGNTIYITPPNKNIRLDGEIIRLFTPSGEAFTPKPSVDIFFESLSYSKKNYAVGIILSGTGSDGTRGMQCIKAEGGITMAQEPSSAKYNGMPLSAINAQSVDMVLNPTQMAEELPEIVSHIREGKTSSVKTDSTYMEKILMRINQAKNIDFSEYKPTTISRRVHRRMAALKMNDASEYVDYLYKNDAEPDNLFRDIIIGVTEFFRDEDAFLECSKNLEDIVLKKGTGGSLRIWDVGCATGEETYTIGILVLEMLKRNNLYGKITVQIFATDINPDATRAAREGIYPVSALSSLSKKTLQDYFVPENEFYRVSKELRDIVIFSQHDIIKDPPFLRIDALVCRNLLIYFSQKLQDRIFPLFHYTLNNGGLLFLGKSEAIGHFENLFTTLSKDKKVYRREFSIRKEIPNVNFSRKNSYDLTKGTQKEKNEKTLEEYVIEGIGAYFMPMSIVVNEGMDIIYVREKNPYIGFPAGGTTMNVYKCLEDELVAELRTLLHECQKNMTPKAGVFQHLKKSDGSDVSVRMTVIPLLYGKNISRIYIINFQEEKQDLFIEVVSEEGKRSGGVDQVRKLESELNRTKVHLQAVIEELETTNEELQALNEELQSSNEELQSSNEELETTNEELQSTNEELQTAYAELKAVSDEREIQRDLAEKRLDESIEVKTLLQEVLDSSLSAVMAFDSLRDDSGEIVDFEWTLVNKEAEKLLQKNAKELIGNSLLKEMPGSKTAGLFARYVGVVDSGEAYSGQKYYKNDGLTLWLNITVVKHKDGCVVTLTDITEQKGIEHERMLFEKSRRGTILELLENLSHQWRQPLNNISLIAQNIEDGYEDDSLDGEELKKKTETIVRTTVELSNLITMFSSIYHDDVAVDKKVSLQECVNKAISVTSKLFESLSITYSISLEKDFKVGVQKSDLVEVLISLFMNIADAVAKNKVTLPVVAIEGYEDGDSLYVSVKDNCGGIDKEMLPKVFDPYTTTKFKSFSKGLGLFIAKNIVEIKLRGEIFAKNNKDGAEFIIRLPNE
ncbi:MAG: chemotaxis protein CheB [Campylobacterales bacterium]